MLGGFDVWFVEVVIEKVRSGLNYFKHFIALNILFKKAVLKTVKGISE